jgi:hypothetical protein
MIHGDPAAFTINVAAITPVGAENCPERLRPPGTDQACQSDDFTVSQVERYPVRVAPEAEVSYTERRSIIG